MASDPTFLLWGGSAIATYLIIGFGFLMVEKLHWLRSSKCQPYKDPLTPLEYREIWVVAARNLLMVHWPFSLALFKLWKHQGGTDMPLEPQSAIKHLIVCALVIEFWFYWTHRLFHYGWLYAAFHKMHHRFTAPTSFCSVYAHCVEFCIGNFMGVALGPAITGCNSYVGCFWYILTMSGTCLTHSGYGLMSAVHHHDMHHEFFNCNYGVSDLCDYLFGTTAAGYGYEDKKKKRVAKHLLASTSKKKP